MTTLPTTVAAGSSGHVTHHNELHKAHNAGNMLWWYIDGDAAVSVGTGRLRPGVAGELIECFMDAGTAPSGVALIANIRKNGVLILSGASRPRLAAASTTGAKFSLSDASFTDTDYFTADVEQIGSPTPGADVTLTVRWRPV